MTTLQIIEILVRIAWLVGAVAFVIGLSRMNSPATATSDSSWLIGDVASAAMSIAPTSTMP